MARLRNRIETATAWLAFPVILMASLFATMAIMDAGVPPFVAFIGPVVVSFLLIALLEKTSPFETQWSHSRGDLGVDIGHALVSGGLTLGTLRPFVLAGSVAAAGWLAATLGRSIWPENWPLLAQLVLALVVGEFFMYWVHRLTHMYDGLWRIHAMHHSAPRLYFLNSIRFHPIDIALSIFIPLFVLAILGAQQPVLALFTVTASVHGAFQHANTKIRCGPLNWFFSMAELHRWHHSRRPEEANSNFGQNLIVWDIVFGTRFLPADRMPPVKIGLGQLPSFPMNYLGQLGSPFRWATIKRESGESLGRL